jgi:FtsP/CotA-like multicopper oxidase with cupredoxin domain
MERLSGTTNPIATTSARPSDLFSTETTGLSDAAPPQPIRLQDGDRFDLRIEPVRKRLDDAELRMLGYNGSIPGPTLHVDQGSEITVEVTNDGDVDATVHWHGLRLENRYDGVPHDTQAPIPVGGTFTYKVQFPDAGFYWYHPHIREDFGLEMGLYGTIIVDPSDPSYWPAVDRHLTLTLDDLLVEDGHVAPFHRSGPNYTAMGRFGNVMLINGETEFADQAAVGEVVRLYLVNTANTRIFNFAVRGARTKLVGGDSGRYERETWVDEVLLAPSERVVLDVLFDVPGEVRLEHRTPDHVYDLGAFSVSGTSTGTASGSFADLRVDRELTGEHQSMQEDLTRPPDKVLAFVSSMPLLYGGDIQTSSYACPMHPEVTDSKPGTCPKCGMQLVPVQTESPEQSGYVCPMHPEVTDSKPGTCPKCGMKLVPVQAETTEPSSSYVCPMHPEVTDSKPGTCPKCGMKLVPSDAAPTEKDEVGSLHEHEVDGLEWEDLMPEINRASDPSNMFWKLIDRESGSENGAINWAFTVGDRVKIRLVNEMESDHPMHHPFHIHGAGRFLVLSRDAEPESNLVWKDTVLVRAGQEVDILLDVSNPGLWMAHCHIAEHAQTGMMFSFDVARAEE